jgi:hypothetical protein
VSIISERAGLCKAAVGGRCLVLGFKNVVPYQPTTDHCSVLKLHSYPIKLQSSRLADLRSPVIAIRVINMTSSHQRGKDFIDEVNYKFSVISFQLSENYRKSETRNRRLKKVLLLALLALTLCCSKVGSHGDIAFVVPERLRVKSSTAHLSRNLAELKSGDRVTVARRATSEDGTPWSMVSGPGGESGWVETRHLVKGEAVEKSRGIADEIRGIQTQAIGRSKATLKLRLTPDRSNDGNVATLLPSGTELEIVGRDRKPKPKTLVDVNDEAPATGKTSPSSEFNYDVWYKVRLKDSPVLPAGWIYGGSVGLEVPADIVYFVSSGRRITGWQKIGTVHGEDGRTGDHYLVMERKVFNPDEEVDFDRIKVLAYDPYSRNYSTPFREDVSGRFPVTISMKGTQGQFQISTVNHQKQAENLTYRVEMFDGGKINVVNAVSR